MHSFCFLHAADIHLDSPLRGLEADPNAPAELLRGATREALDNLVDLALERKVAFVLIAGDLYDGDWPDWRTGQFLVERAARLTREGIGLYIVGGNHDADSQVSKQLRLPDGAHKFSSRTVETIRVPGLDVAIHGRSFPERAVNEDLTESYPSAIPGVFNIGLLHTSLTGRPPHAVYAPTDEAALRRLGYHYWALGHVHTREVVSQDPWIVFPGNLQGRHARETGAKGASLIEVRNGRIDSVEHHPLDVVRWARIEVTLDPEEGDENRAMARVGQALEDAACAADGRLLAARVTLSGRSPLHEALMAHPGAAREKVIAEAGQLGADRVWVEKVEIATTPARTRDPEGQPEAIARLLGAIGEVTADPEMLGELDYARKLRGLLGRAELPPDHPLMATPFPPADEIAAASELLLARLAEKD